MVGGIEVCDILEKPGVAGDLREDWEDTDWISARDEEFLRESEMLDAALSLREKSPILAVLIGVSVIVGGVVGSILLLVTGCDSITQVFFFFFWSREVTMSREFTGIGDRMKPIGGFGGGRGGRGGGEELSIELT